MQFEHSARSCCIAQLWLDLLKYKYICCKNVATTLVANRKGSERRHATICDCLKTHRMAIRHSKSSSSSQGASRHNCHSVCRCSSMHKANRDWAPTSRLLWPAILSMVHTQNDLQYSEYLGQSRCTRRLVHLIFRQFEEPWVNTGSSYIL